MSRLILIILLLIVYGSLYPWQVHTPAFPIHPLSILLHSWPAALNRFVLRDAIVNVILYMPLGTLGYLHYAPRWGPSRALARILGFALVLSATIELVQLAEPARYSSAFDIVCNLAGAAAGILVARLYSKSLTSILARDEIDAFLHPTAAAILLFCWIGYQAFPFFPQLRTTQLALKIQALGSPAVSPVELIASVVDWLAAAAVAEAIVGRARAGVVLASIMLLLPGRLFLDTRTMDWAECIGAALAWIAFRFLREWGNRFSLLAWLSVGALILRGLAPFRFTSASGHFSWIPFAASLSYDHATAFIVFFRKCFLYGAAIWLFNKAGQRYVAGTIGVAALLGAVEAVQIHLPGRTPEITDPLLAVLMALLLKLSGEHQTSMPAAGYRTRESTPATGHASAGEDLRL